MTKFTTLGILAAVACLGAANAAAWWNDDDYHDRWYGGPWYGGYPGYYGRGGYPGYGGWRGYPGYGWGGYPGYGQGSPSTIIVHPPSEERAPETERQLPR